MTSEIDGAPRTRQGRLTGPSRRLDRRINAVRDDLADVALADVVTAQRYAAGVHRAAVVAATMVHTAPDAEAVAVSTLLHGEVFIVFDVAGGPGGWAWGKCLHDQYVGWTRLSHLGPVVTVSHRIAVPAAPVFAAADIKARVVGSLPLNARVAAKATGDTPFVAAAGGFVHARHVAPLATSHNDPVAVALGFTATPYVWGGRTRDGIDCSGLTQAALLACGIFCPRDSDQQGEAFAAVDPADRRRGDLVLFPGHVGILTDPDTLLHANAYWMTTLAEPLADVAARVAPTGFRRPPAIVASPCSGAGTSLCAPAGAVPVAA